MYQVKATKCSKAARAHLHLRNPRSMWGFGTFEQEEMSGQETSRISVQDFSQTVAAL